MWPKSLSAALLLYVYGSLLLSTPAFAQIEIPPITDCPLGGCPPSSLVSLTTPAPPKPPNPATSATSAVHLTDRPPGPTVRYKTNTGAIAGGVVGGAVAGALLASIAFGIFKFARRRRERASRSDRTLPPLPPCPIYAEPPAAIGDEGNPRA